MNINAVIQPAGFVLPVSLQLYELLMAEAGEIPAHKHRICEANTLGSCGYVYIAIYPTASRSSGQ